MTIRGRAVVISTLVMITGLVAVQTQYLPTVQTERPMLQRPSLTQAQAAYGQLGLTFELNQGQTDPAVKFLSRRSGYVMFLTSSEAVFKLPMPAAFTKPAVQRPDEARKGETPDAWVDHDTKGGRPAWAGHDSELKRTTTGRPPWAGSDTEFDNQPQSRSAILRMKIAGANPDARAEGVDRRPGVAHYYRGKDPSKWQTNVPLYSKVAYKEIYPGIDLVYYGNQRELEYDFVVAPGRSPDVIALAFEGADRVAIERGGDLTLQVADSTLVHRQPIAYQEVDGVRRSVESRYVQQADGEIGFEVGSYDRSLPLVIDPTFVYSTFLGGSLHDQAYGISVDAQGRAHVTGKTSSADFPTTPNAFQEQNKTTFRQEESGNDIFVTKLNATGSDILFSTYIGGQEEERGQGIDVDPAGGVHVSGWTSSGIGGLKPEFPTTDNAFQRDINGPDGKCIDSADSSQSEDRPLLRSCLDAVYVKLNSAGQLVYSTYFGGSAEERGMGVAALANGTAIIAGFSKSYDFPATPGAFQPELVDPDPDQANLPDPPGNDNDDNEEPAPDVLVAKFDSTKSGKASLIYATLVGGHSVDRGYAIAADAAGNALVTGYTSSRKRKFHGGGFPVTPGAFDRSFNTREPDDKFNAEDSGENCCDVGSDSFVIKLNATGTKLIFSTFLGASDALLTENESRRNGEWMDAGHGIALDGAGNVYVTGNFGGFGSSTDEPPIGNKLWPTTANAYDREYNGGEADAFVVKMNPAGSRLLYSSTFGGTGEEVGNGIAVSGANIYIIGTTDPTGFEGNPNPINAEATNFPVKNSMVPAAGAGDLELEDAFFAKFNTSRSGGASLVFSTLLRGRNQESTSCFDFFNPSGRTEVLCPGDTSSSSNSVGEDTGRAIDVVGGFAYVTGGTKNVDFPTTLNAFQKEHASAPLEDAWVAKISDANPSTTLAITASQQRLAKRTVNPPAPAQATPARR